MERSKKSFVVEEKWAEICHHYAFRAMGRRTMGRLTHAVVPLRRRRRLSRATN
jgi:hypothetical protein